MSKLHNVRGRITYISSHAKQENLYAVYETTDRHYWTELARFNQQEFLKSGTEGKCIEARELKNKLFHEALEKEYGSKAVIKADDTADVVSAPVKETITKPEPPSVTITATVPETKVIEQPKPQIPPRPVMPPEAVAFPRLQKVKVTLDKHNHLIFEAERERTKLEIELSDLKGLARLTKKKELEGRIATQTEEIRTLKAGLSGIVRQHGFATVQDFYTAFYTAQHATEAYQKECDKWEEAYGEKASQKTETMHEKIQRYKEKADKQNASQPYRSRDKGAR